jgi:hypothetical protein
LVKDNFAYETFKEFFLFESAISKAEVVQGTEGKAFVW